MGRHWIDKLLMLSPWYLVEPLPARRYQSAHGVLEEYIRPNGNQCPLGGCWDLTIKNYVIVKSTNIAAKLLDRARREG
jgi:hypothetical protein